MIIDLRQGFGDFGEYNIFKFPDQSIKFQLRGPFSDTIKVIAALKSQDDIFTLALVKNTIDTMYKGRVVTTILDIKYLMYQQDDRQFTNYESFGLKVLSNFINNLNFSLVQIFHPHSDKVEFINNLNIISNDDFILSTTKFIELFSKDNIWVIPDAGAAKTQLKQIEKLQHKKFIQCVKSRNHETGEIKTIVHTEDLQGQNCFIIDDICLGGRTFINIAKELKAKNCGKLYLIVSHGIFNNGTEELVKYFETIYTTDSVCSLGDYAHDGINKIDTKIRKYKL